MQGGQSDSHRHRNTVRIAGYDINTGAGGTVTVQPITNDYRNTFFRTEVLGRFSTGWLSHDMTVGLSQSERYSVSYDLQTITLPQRQNIFAPVELAAPVFTRPGTARPPQRLDTTNRGGPICTLLMGNSSFNSRPTIRSINSPRVNRSIGRSSTFAPSRRIVTLSLMANS